MKVPHIKIKIVLSKKTLVLGGGILALFIALNLGSYFYFLHRSYPNTRIHNKPIGTATYGELSERGQTLSLLPETIQLQYQDKTSDISLTELGVQVDYDKTAEYVADHKHWLPILNFISSHNIPLLLTIDDAIFQKSITAAVEEYKQEPVNAQLVLDGGNFSIKDEVRGAQPDIGAVKEALLATLNSDSVVVELPAQTLEPEVKHTNLEESLSTLQKQQNTSLIYRYGSKSKQYSPQEIGAWYVAEGTSFVLSDAAIKDALKRTGTSFGITVQNITQAVSATKEAVQQNKSLDFTFIPVPRATKHYTYCVASKNADESYLPGLIAKLSAVYGDGRGWGLGGQITFSKVDSGCSFTVWLSAADQMTSFSATICDSTWSCRVGSNVIINFDRWRYASDAWNQAGGSLEDYRVMVINHETGHWLGFGHKNCSGAGQPAPVMQQQSIDLQGCTFNSWPTQSELSTLKANLGL